MLRFARCLSPVPLALALFATAWVQASLTHLGSTRYPPTDPDSVRIYLDEDDVPGPYEKPGLVRASGESSWTTTEQRLEKVRAEAAGLGANGVLVESVDEPGAGATVAGAFLGTGSQRTGRMVALCVHADTTAAPNTAARPAAHPLRGSNR